MLKGRLQVRCVLWATEDYDTPVRARRDVRTFGWRYEIDSQGGTLHSKRGVRDDKLKQIEGNWELDRRLKLSTSERRHDYDSLLEIINASPTQQEHKRPKALYNTINGDQIIKPFSLPNYLVHNKLNITQKHNGTLVFYVYSWGLQFSSPQAFRILGNLLENNETLKCLDTLTWDTGLVFRCEVQNISPEMLININKRGYPIRVVGVVDKKTYLQELDPTTENIRQASVVLRASSASSLRKVISNSGGSIMFPNFISFDSLGLGSNAGVFSDEISLEIGSKILRQDFDGAISSIIRAMPRVNAGLERAEEDLDQETRDFRMSSRFYNQIPENHSWVKQLITNRIEKGSYFAIYETNPEILNRFTMAVAASIWNNAAAVRLELDPEFAVDGDLLLSGKIYKKKKSNKVPISQVALPTIGPKLEPSEWPHSCGGFTSLSSLLGTSGVRMSDIRNMVFLPESVLRPIVATAENVKITTKKGSLTEYVRGFWGGMLRDKLSPSLILNEATGRIYGNTWHCVPCGVHNPATALRCMSCSSHVVSDTNPAYDDSGTLPLAKLKTHFISAEIPKTSSITTLVSEFFNLYAFHQFPDQPHVASLIQRSRSSVAYAKLNSGKKFPGIKKYRAMLQTRSERREPQLPAALRKEPEPRLEWQFQHPSSPLNPPACRLVEIVPAEEVRVVEK